MLLPSRPAPDRPPAPRQVATESSFDEAVLTKPNHGKRVFRVAETRLRSHAPLGGLLGIVGGFTITSLAPAGGGVASAIVLGAAVMGFALGSAVGVTRHMYRCATCESLLDATAAVCPACGGTIAGDIANRNQRLEAEDDLETDEHGATDASADDPDDTSDSVDATRTPRGR